MVVLQQDSVLGGRYKVGERLSDNIYKVRDQVNGKMLAAKFVRADPQLEGMVHHMGLVAATVGKLAHPNVVKVHEMNVFGKNDFYFIMDLVQGPDLMHVLQNKGTMPWAHAKPVFIQLCDGLEALHGIQLVHRDLKPSNIMLSESSSGMQVKLIGYLHGSLPDSDFLKFGYFYGTPEYSAPEQISSSVRQRDNRKDIFSVGIIMYKTLSGVIPNATKDSLEMLIRRMHIPIPKLSEAKPGISAKIEAVVMKALEKSPEQRFQSAAELRGSILSI